MDEKASGIILRVRPLTETSLIVHWLTKEFGRIATVAKGARLMFLTRLGFSSKAVITGDPTQIDLPGHKQSGLVEATYALEKVEGIAMVRFSKKDVVRHALVQRIIGAYELHRGTKNREPHRDES